LKNNIRKEPESLEGFQEIEPMILGEVAWIGQDEDEDEE
jgi:hypothetical protein